MGLRQLHRHHHRIRLRRRRTEAQQGVLRGRIQRRVSSELAILPLDLIRGSSP